MSKAIALEDHAQPSYAGAYSVRCACGARLGTLDQHPWTANGYAVTVRCASCQSSETIALPPALIGALQP